MRKEKKKRKDDRKEKVKGSWPWAHTMHSVTYIFLLECAVLSCVQITVWLPVFGIFNVSTDVDACDCM